MSSPRLKDVPRSLQTRLNTERNIFELLSCRPHTRGYICRTLNLTESQARNALTMLKAEGKIECRGVDWHVTETQ